MRKVVSIVCCALGLVACDKHDPILPGVRTAVFQDTQVIVQNKSITDTSLSEIVIDNSKCPYSQDSLNTIWEEDKKIFSGFPTSDTVSANRRPVCSGQYLYAGLTTGEVIKINPKTRKIAWIADLYRASNLTGGSSTVDIVAPIIPYGKWVYAGGLGDAFCKISAATGDKKWCLDIGVAVPFVLTEKYAFVVGTDNYLYAIETASGDVYWRTLIESAQQPVLQNNLIIVDNESINLENGKKILDK